MPTLGDPSKIPDPAQRTVDPQELVQYRMSQMMKQDNAYTHQAITNAKKMANQQGLLNTSIAASAGVDAAIRSILPIAQQDAATLHGQALENQRAVNEFLMQDYLMKNQFKLTEHGYQVNTYNQSLQQAHQKNENAVERWWKGRQNELDRELQIWGAKADTELQKLLKGMGIEAAQEESGSVCQRNAYARFNARVGDVMAGADQISTERYNLLMQQARDALTTDLSACG